MISFLHRAAPAAPAKTSRFSRSFGAAFGLCLFLFGGALPVAAPRAAAAVSPEDVVVLDFDGRSIVVANGGFTGTFGALTTVAASGVGSGVAFPPVGNGGVAVGVSQGCVSPAKQLYYWDSTILAFVALDLTQAGYPRVRVPVPANKALVPANVQYATGNLVLWDFSTGTILYLDGGAPAGGSAASSIPRGIYRLNPATGVNTLVVTVPSAQINGLAVAPDGTIYALMASTLGTASAVAKVNLDGTFTTVDGGTAATPRYYQAEGLSWDFFNQKLSVFDVGDDRTTARVLRVTPGSPGTRVYVTNGSAGAAGTNGGTVLNAPSSGYLNTQGRLLYSDATTDLSHVTLATIPNGSATASLVTATQFGAEATSLTFVPPSLPVITSPTATGSSTTSETLGANVTSAGAALAAPTVQTRGVVYSATATNANPAIGGTGVTQAAASAATGVFTVSATGLNPGTQYSYAAYVSTYYGLVYTAVGTFTTPSLATVISPTATGITGASATLGGNVTADGGSTLTARGVVYAVTSVNGTPALGGTGVTTLTDASATTGVFTDGTGSVLANGTAYSYRAYATNAAGTAYSATGTFATAARPTANAQSVTTAFNTARAITLTGSDPNTPAQTLTYTVATAPTHGTLSGTAPNLTYTPTASYQGADGFTFTTTNTAGLTSSSATVGITVTAGTPTANAQSVSVPFNIATAITLTATDPDSPALPLNYTVVTAPTHGTLSGTAPNLTYTPAANYQGADGFTFRASNGTNTSNTATISITVAAGTPTAASQSVVTQLDTAKAITLAGTDPDSPALALTYTVAAAPANGTLAGTAPNLTYTPASGYSGPDSFTFTVSNGQKTSAAATVSITVIGQPYITSFTASGTVGSTVTINGGNFLGTTGVTFFRNVPATTFTVVSNTQLTVVVPATAKTGVISVTTGVGSNTTATKFIVTP